MNGVCVPGFDRLLDFMETGWQGNGSEIIYGVWPDFRLAYFNEGWVRFARENGGAPWLMSPECLGRSVLEVTTPELRPFYRELFTRAITTVTARPYSISHEYECSSAEIYRKFAMLLFRLKGGQGLLIANSLVVEMPHTVRGTVPVEPSANSAPYHNEHELVIQCAACRRIRHQQLEGRWDWIPAWVSQPPERTSHGLCDLCMSYYYPAKG
ncbi:hypothetical protein F6V30_10090 [Oryzomonas sagensis]|uniref:PAS domain-containing protein n=1 Tax=Oryzomonas sagensis TaxID=2603857 RepID=A0ABQ6TPC7_9BACT|nr:hypothetical protein [Oryzomonas sagensis]KAB0670484.1 hypothetical protein F6V30_10090 [Oryzomonas sagensis]